MRATAEAHYIADVHERRRAKAPRTASACDLVRQALESRGLPEAARERLELALIGLDAVLSDGGEIEEKAARELVEFIAEHTA